MSLKSSGPVALARKTENENYNAIKTKGYHLKHNFGHGQQHLASFLLTLNVLAFVFHKVLHLLIHPTSKSVSIWEHGLASSMICVL